LDGVIDSSEVIAIASNSLSVGYQLAIEEFAKSKGRTFYILGSSDTPVQVKKKRVKATPAFEGEILGVGGGGASTSKSPRGVKTTKTLEDALNDEIYRGVFYVEIFGPLRLPPAHYSLLISHLERCTPKARRVWLEGYLKSSTEQQSEQVKEIVERLHV
jgi:hypothetical protein